MFQRVLFSTVFNMCRLSNKTYASSLHSTNAASCAASAALYWHEARQAVSTLAYRRLLKLLKQAQER